MGQHLTLGAGPAQIMGQPRLYGCRRLCSGWTVQNTLSIKHSTGTYPSSRRNVGMIENELEEDTALQ